MLFRIFPVMRFNTKKNQIRMFYTRKQKKKKKKEKEKKKKI